MAPFFFCLCTYSLGGESLSVVQSTFCAKWFKGNELALAFGITLSFSRIVRVLAPTLAYNRYMHTRTHATDQLSYVSREVH